MDRDVGLTILRAIDQLEEPFGEIERCIDGIDDGEERSRLRRKLGQLMAELDTDIAYPIRLKLDLVAPPE